MGAFELPIIRRIIFIFRLGQTYYIANKLNESNTDLCYITLLHIKLDTSTGLGLQTGTFHDFWEQLPKQQVHIWVGQRRRYRKGCAKLGRWRDIRFNNLAKCQWSEGALCFLRWWTCYGIILFHRGEISWVWRVYGNGYRIFECWSLPLQPTILC